MGGFISIHPVDEPVSTALLNLGIPAIATISAIVNVGSLVFYHRSLLAAIKMLWETYRVLDSKPEVMKASSLILLAFLWHQVPLCSIISGRMIMIYFTLIITDVQICFIAFLVEGAFKGLQHKIKEHYKLLVHISEDTGPILYLDEPCFHGGQHHGLDLFNLRQLGNLRKHISEDTGPILYLDEPCFRGGQHHGLDLFKLRQVHRQLFHVVSTANTAYNLAAFVVTFSCRFLITIYLYRWIVSKFVTLQLIYALLTLQRIFYICYRFEALKRVEKTTTDMVNGLDKSPLDTKMRAEFKLFLIQLKSNKMAFNSIHMFDLDFTLITSMFTTTITYLMLLQQFS